mmetsp:Transcript_16470/g.25613  ORF Transcript_16470/g.25613 Transcript_16470/m.25613 type:complete len:273 (-) Transcript_16470:1387-2205(-)
MRGMSCACATSANHALVLISTSCSMISGCCGVLSSTTSMKSAIKRPGSGAKIVSMSSRFNSNASPSSPSLLPYNMSLRDLAALSPAAAAASDVIISTLLFIRFKSSTSSSTLLFSTTAGSSASRSSLAQIMAVTVSRRASSSMIITPSPEVALEVDDGSVNTSGISQHSSGFPKHNCILEMIRSLSSNNVSLATSSVNSFANCFAFSFAFAVDSALTAQSGSVSGIFGGARYCSTVFSSLPSSRCFFSSAALIDRCVSAAAASIKFRTPSVR